MNEVLFWLIDLIADQLGQLCLWFVNYWTKSTPWKLDTIQWKTSKQGIALCEALARGTYSIATTHEYAALYHAFINIIMQFSREIPISHIKGNSRVLRGKGVSARLRWKSLTCAKISKLNLNGCNGSYCTCCPFHVVHLIVNNLFGELRGRVAAPLLLQGLRGTNSGPKMKILSRKKASVTGRR